MQLKGLFISNAFLNGMLYDRVKRVFLEAAQAEGITLLPKTNADVLAICNGGLSCKVNEDIDFIIFYDKDIRLAQALTMSGKRLFNSAAAIEACDDKALTHLKLSGEAIPQPKTILCPKTFPIAGYSHFEFLDYAGDILGYPMIIKERFGSLGEQVYLAHSRAEAENILKAINGREAILQEHVTEGKDLRINIVGGEYIAAMRRISDGDFRANISCGGRAERVQPSEEEIKLALNSCKALGLDFAGVDILWRRDGTPVVCEVNSNAHTNGFYACTGINVADYIIRHIKETLT